MPDLHLSPSRGASGDSRGFTLVEVLVASLLFAVGMMAAMAMQYSVLSGYASTRDMTNATQVGERVIHIIKTESQQWRTASDVTSANLSPVYTNATSDSDVHIWSSNRSLLERAVSNAGWSPVFKEPVDARLTHAGMRQYCAYVRGHQMKDSSGSKGLGLVQLQVTVLYPSPDQTFPDSGGDGSSTAYGSCTGFDTSLDTLLKPAPWGQVSTYEEEGYRAIHMGAHVIQRRHLGGTGQRFGRFGS